MFKRQADIDDTRLRLAESRATPPDDLVLMVTVQKPGKDRDVPADICVNTVRREAKKGHESMTDQNEYMVDGLFGSLGDLVKANNVTLSPDQIKDVIRDAINTANPGTKWDIPDSDDKAETKADSKAETRSAGSAVGGGVLSRNEPSRRRVPSGDRSRPAAPSGEDGEAMRLRHEREWEDLRLAFQRAKEDLKADQNEERDAAGFDSADYYEYFDDDDRDSDDDDHPGRGKGRGRGRGKGRGRRKD